MKHFGYGDLTHGELGVWRELDGWRVVGIESLWCIESVHGKTLVDRELGVKDTLVYAKSLVTDEFGTSRAYTGCKLGVWKELDG